MDHTKAEMEGLITMTRYHVRPIVYSSIMFISAICYFHFMNPQVDKIIKDIISLNIAAIIFSLAHKVISITILNFIKGEGWYKELEDTTAVHSLIGRIKLSSNVNLILCTFHLCFNTGSPILWAEYYQILEIYAVITSSILVFSIFCTWEVVFLYMFYSVKKEIGNHG